MLDKGIYLISYDVGTTGVKTCLFKIFGELELRQSALEGYKLQVLENGGVEQNPEDWWKAMCITTKRVIQNEGIDPKEVRGISFCAQMQGVVLVDSNGDAIRPAMSYMDNRAVKEHREGIGHGFKISGLNILKTLRAIRTTGAVPASVKDPVWKYKWVENNEPEDFKRVHKWLDVKEYLISKATGEFIMTKDSAFATLLYDSRSGKECFSKEICKMLGVNINHMPKVVKSSELVGTITEKASKELGLSIGTAVFGGGGDASLIGVGAGATKDGDTHIYLGTSGWVSTVVSKRLLDLNHMIASIVGAKDERYNYFAELETAGKCLEWVKDHLALDEIGLYLSDNPDINQREDVKKRLYDYMMEVIKDIPAGSNGVIFTPWLHGNRCPFEDPKARGMFFNISIDTGKTELIHSVIEGICYHLRWQLEASEKKVETSDTIRLVGGGALAPLTCQILSDVTGKQIQTVENPQNVGAVGAAILAAVGLGIINDIDSACDLIKDEKSYTPNEDNKEIYDKYFEVFKSLYKDNKKSFHKINR